VFQETTANVTSGMIGGATLASQPLTGKRSVALKVRIKRWWPDIQAWPARLASFPFVPIPLRMRVLSLVGHEFEDMARIRPGTLVTGRRLRLGRDTIINSGCVVDAHGEVWMGDEVHVSHRVLVLTEDHDPGTPTRRAGPMATRPVRIGTGVWIGAGAVVLPGTQVGEGCVIAAGAVAYGTLEPNTLYGGVPAKAIRELEA
jgi:maltose O-acetyltransferase